VGILVGSDDFSFFLSEINCVEASSYLNIMPFKVSFFVCKLVGTAL
jgi:hypothetical protein